MPRFRVLITDYAWPDVEIERRTLAEVDAELIVAEKEQQHAAGLAALAERHQVDAIMTNWAKVPDKVIAASPKCQIVSRLGIGLDNIDVGYCTSRGIPVTNIPDYCLIEVAEHALALLLSLSRKVAFYHQATKAGRYELQAGPKLRRVEGQTLGIIGLGNIGRKLAEKAMCLGLKIVASSRRPASIPGVCLVEFNELLAASDYVSLHVPFVAATRHMMGSDQFARMKPTAYLINTARGGLVDHAALARALEQGQLAGAALDVQDTEPPNLSQPPFNDPRVIVTPHAAFASEESLADLRLRVSRQVAARLTGQLPENVVNGIG
jgi:D-3-phosphoglycerate dehydrogenase / 2-oxoglutarate reductase